MSSQRGKIPARAAALYRDAPYLSALLRMAFRASRQRSLEALAGRGFGDINDALMNAFNFPPPDGVRLSEFADRMNATKQAANYVAGKLEELGYFERRAEKPGGQRLVYLTRRGWQVFETIWETQRQRDQELAGSLGEEAFGAFKDVLRELAAGAEPLPDHPED